MMKMALLAGLTCAVGLTAPALGQHLPWLGSLGGAIGGYGILGTTPADNAPLLALNLDRMAHVTGDFSHALVSFDRVILPDGSAVLMRRVSDPRNPNIFGYLPKSWPAVGMKGIVRLHGADGKVIATRDIIIPQWEIEAQPIPLSGPRVGTIVVERDVMSDGSVQVAETVKEPEPAVAVALLEAIKTGENLSGRTFAIASR